MSADSQIGSNDTVQSDSSSSNLGSSQIHPKLIIAQNRMNRINTPQGQKYQDELLELRNMFNQIYMRQQLLSRQQQQAYNTTAPTSSSQAPQLMQSNPPAESASAFTDTINNTDDIPLTQQQLQQISIFIANGKRHPLQSRLTGVQETQVKVRSTFYKIKKGSANWEQSLSKTCEKLKNTDLTNDEREMLLRDEKHAQSQIAQAEVMLQRLMAGLQRNNISAQKTGKVIQTPPSASQEQPARPHQLQSPQVNL